MTESCRTCMTSSVNMRNLFSEDSQDVLDKIAFCTGLQLMKDDNLPSMICSECFNQAEIAYKFKTKCLQAEETFQKLLLSIKEEALDTGFSDDLNCQNNDELKSVTDLKFEEFNVSAHHTNADDAENTKKLANTKTNNNKKIIKKRRLYKKKGTPGAAAPPAQATKLRVRTPRCKPCGLVFVTQREWRQHDNECHDGAKCWMCECELIVRRVRHRPLRQVCGKVFPHQGSLTTHARSHRPPQHKCALCDYAAYQKGDLSKHMRLHTGTKQYQCESCTRAYYTSSNLLSHIRRVHRGEKRHQCGECGRRFYDRSKLNRHVDSHHDIKRYECSVCPASFSRRCYWKRHLERHHSVVVPPQRPGRRKTNLLVGEHLMRGGQPAVSA